MVWVSFHESSDVFNDISRVVLRDERAPPRANALRAVDQAEGDDRQVVVRLNSLAFLFKVVQHGVVVFWEQSSGDRREVGENVPGAGCLFSALVPCAELPDGEQ